MFVLRRSISHLFVVVFFVVAPSAAALGYYYITKNPTIRPLGITRESLDAYERGHTSAVFEIVAHIAYDPRHSGGISQDELHRALTTAFRAKGVHVNVQLERSEKAGTWITYVVGPSTIGPYPLSEGALGINQAVEAYRMTVKAPSD